MIARRCTHGIENRAPIMEPAAKTETKLKDMQAIEQGADRWHFQITTRRNGMSRKINQPSSSRYRLGLLQDLANQSRLSLAAPDLDSGTGLIVVSFNPLQNAYILNIRKDKMGLQEIPRVAQSLTLAILPIRIHN